MAQVKKEGPEDIEILINACKKNDRKAQIRVYELYAKTMYNTSKRIVKNSMVAEDIVQESFLAAFRSLPAYNVQAPFDAWLRRIVINRSIDHIRKQRISFEELRENNYLVVEEPGLNVEAESKETLINEIKKQIEELPDGYRTIFSLFYLEGYDHDEISHILNISASTSRSQLTRAKMRLIELLKNKKIDYAG